MGHECSILKFPTSMSREEIQARCDKWGDANSDWEERGYRCGGLGFQVRFQSDIFETEEEAENYLNKTFGNYRQTAVMFKRSKKEGSLTSKTLEDLMRRKKEYTKRISDLDKPHYASVKQVTVKCKNCGSSLATKYCEKGYGNYCPVCHTDLRPDSIISKGIAYRSTLLELNDKIRAEEKRLKKKAQAAGYDTYWAVACEVHF